MLGRVAKWAALLVAGFVVLLVVEALLALNGGRPLPNNGPLLLDRDFEVEGNTSPPVRLAWLGDSTGAGIGSSGAEAAVVTLVASELNRSVQLRVLARPGARVGDVLFEQLPKLEAVRPDVVVLAVGGNDVTHLTSEPLFETQYDLLIRALRRFEPDGIVSVGIGDFGTVPRIPEPLRSIAEWRGRALDELIREVTTRHGVPYVDLYRKTSRVFAPQPGRYYAVDGFHPNDRGYRVWADAIITVLGPVVSAVA